MFRKLKNLFKKQNKKSTYIKYEVGESGDIFIDISLKNDTESIDNFCSLLSAVSTLYLLEDTVNTVKQSVVPSLGQEIFNQMMIITNVRSENILSAEEDEYIKPSDMINGE
jgi:hypothetical protein